MKAKILDARKINDNTTVVIYEMNVRGTENKERFAACFFTHNDDERFVGYVNEDITERDLPEDELIETWEACLEWPEELRQFEV